MKKRWTSRTRNFGRRASRLKNDALTDYFQLVTSSALDFTRLIEVLSPSTAQTEITGLHGGFCGVSP